MALLLVLFITFGASIIATKYFTRPVNYSLSGRIAMSVMLIFTAIGHFVYADGMTLMVPDFIPFKRELVSITGIIEICAAIGLLIHRLQRITAWLLILFFLLILPANINATLNNIDFQTGTATGQGVTYLWFRVPLQVFFIAWIWFFALRSVSREKV